MVKLEGLNQRWPPGSAGKLDPTYGIVGKDNIYKLLSEEYIYI